jgi:hypothetical protein
MIRGAESKSIFPCLADKIFRLKRNGIKKRKLTPRPFFCWKNGLFAGPSNPRGEVRHRYRRSRPVLGLLSAKDPRYFLKGEFVRRV